jgi:hypothetical protein
MTTGMSGAGLLASLPLLRIEGGLVQCLRKRFAIRALEKSAKRESIIDCHDSPMTYSLAHSIKRLPSISKPPVAPCCSLCLLPAESTQRQLWQMVCPVEHRAVLSATLFDGSPS